MEPFLYEIVVAVNQDGVIGVTDVAGKQRIPWLSEATRSEATRSEATRSEATRSEATRSEATIIKSVSVSNVTLKSEEETQMVREDMRRFRELTMGHILVMGRKTFESLPKRPLPGRTHIVLSRTPSKYDEKYRNTENVYFVRLEYLEELLQFLSYPGSNKRIFICGGEEIYRHFLPKTDRLHITYLSFNLYLEEGERTSHFPELDLHENFNATESTEIMDGKCIFKTFERKRG